MTVNLLNGKADPGHLAGIVDELDPDLVLAQELGPDDAEVLGDRYPHHELRPSLDHQGRGIASRAPAEFGEVPMPWRPALWARLDLGPIRPLITNMHMRNPTMPPWWRSVRIRRGQLDALFQWAEGFIDDGHPFLVAGDMNASPLWPLYRRLEERWDDLVAVWAAESGEETVPTWAWRPGWPRVLRIDHVFGTGARVVSSRVEPVRGTDHAAVVVDLEFG